MLTTLKSNRKNNFKQFQVEFSKVKEWSERNPIDYSWKKIKYSDNQFN